MARTKQPTTPLLTSAQNPAIPLSNYQSAICEWVQNGRGNAAVSAVAGSGKSFTLVEIASRIQGKGVFVAFNRSIATELGAKLQGTKMVAKTIHSLGLAAVRKAAGKIQVDNGGKKYFGYFCDAFDARARSARPGASTGRRSRS